MPTMANIIGFMTSLLLQLVLASGQNATSSKVFTLVNACKEIIWPGIISKGGDLLGEGFSLNPGETKSRRYPSGWSGRIWARTGCNFDKDGKGQCETGSCGKSLNCTVPSNPPNTIAEFTIGDVDFYDVSLVDGFNVPIAVTPLKGQGDCDRAGCDGDLKLKCPSELALVADHKVAACRSACDVFKNATYCCKEANAEQGLCTLSNYSMGFKQVCPATSAREQSFVVTCSAPDYVVAFCASRNQTLCSYHGNNLTCSTSSSGMRTMTQNWWITVLALPLLISIHCKF